MFNIHEQNNEHLSIVSLSVILGLLLDMCLLFQRSCRLEFGTKTRGW